MGVIDPTRLASAIDIQGAAPPLAPHNTVLQNKCWSCGGVVDATRESHCSHCHAILKNIDSQRALAASAAVEEKVRQNYHQQLPTVSSKKLQDVADHHAFMSTAMNRMDRRHALTRQQVLYGLMLVVPILLLGASLLVQWQRGEASALPPVQHPTTPATWSAAAPPTPTPPATPASSARPPVAPLATVPPEPDGPSLETMFSFPAMECAADTRSAVKIRQITVVALPSDQPGVSGVDNRKAYTTLQQARQELLNGTPFSVVLQRYGSPGVVNAQPVTEFFGRGTGKPEVERAAFCLPVQTLSPIFKSAAGFHLIQVLEVR